MLDEHFEPTAGAKLAIRIEFTCRAELAEPDHEPLTDINFLTEWRDYKPCAATY